MKKVLFLVVAGLLVFAACDDDPISANVESVVTYRHVSDSDTVEVGIGTKDGARWVSSYKLSVSGTSLSSSNSAGIVQLTNNAFSINLNSEDSEEVLTGVHSGDNVSGTYAIRVSSFFGTQLVTGTYSANR